MDNKGMNIYQRLNEVRKAVSYARKDKRVEGSGYMAITHDAVTALVREHFVAHGIVVTVSLDKSAMIDSTTKTGKGIPIMRYEATYDVAFVNADEPADRVLMRIESHALDQGDKAPGKAISYAVKYAMLKLLSIETGEDDESRVPAYAPLKESAKSVPRGDWEALEKRDPDLAADLMAAAAESIEAMNAGNIADAVEIYREKKAKLNDPSEESAFWFLFSSKQKSAIRAFSKNISAP